MGRVVWDLDRVYGDWLYGHCRDTRFPGRVVGCRDRVGSPPIKSRPAARSLARLLAGTATFAVPSRLIRSLSWMPRPWPLRVLRRGSDSVCGVGAFFFVLSTGFRTI